jgi:hypothetical protein
LCGQLPDKVRPLGRQGQKVRACASVTKEQRSQLAQGFELALLQELVPPTVCPSAT